jgi:hypothetical protein
MPEEPPPMSVEFETWNLVKAREPTNTLYKYVDAAIRQGFQLTFWHIRNDDVLPIDTLY